MTQILSQRPNGARDRACVHEACSALILPCNTILPGLFYFGRRVHAANAWSASVFYPIVDTPHVKDVKGVHGYHSAHVRCHTSRDVVSGTAGVICRDPQAAPAGNENGRVQYGIQSDLVSKKHQSTFSNEKRVIEH